MMGVLKQAEENLDGRLMSISMFRFQGIGGYRGKVQGLLFRVLGFRV